MKLSPDTIILGVPNVQAARDFYTAVFSPETVDHGEAVTLDLHGTGRLALYEAEETQAPNRFRGYTLNYTVDQPSEVEAVMATAGQAGAEVVKPAKKSLFAGVAGVFRAPDGAIWKIAAPTRKDTGPASNPPQPTETVVILGVVSPKVTRDFYTALGMMVDRDYGDKFIDFQQTPGMCRLGLMTRKSLAKDAGLRDDGGVPHFPLFTHKIDTRDEIDALLDAARAAGASVERDGSSGTFRDPDGWAWRVETVEHSSN